MIKIILTFVAIILVVIGYLQYSAQLDNQNNVKVKDTPYVVSDKNAVANGTQAQNPEISPEDSTKEALTPKANNILKPPHLSDELIRKIEDEVYGRFKPEFSDELIRKIEDEVYGKAEPKLSDELIRKIEDEVKSTLNN